jgi:hypothetical protein
MTEGWAWMSSWSVRSLHCSRTARATWGPHRNRNEPSQLATINVEGSGNLRYPTSVRATNVPGKALTRFVLTNASQRS